MTRTRLLGLAALSFTISAMLAAGLAVSSRSWSWGVVAAGAGDLALRQLRQFRQHRPTSA